jgi:putative flippase GtrA
MSSARASLRTLLEPDSGMLGQGVRYVIAGGLVSLVYLFTTTFLALVVGLPFQVALPIGFGCGLVVHFTLQRLFVWVHHEAFALPLRRQARRYLTLAGAQYGTTALTTSLLPGPLGLPTEVVYLATAALLTSTNFLVFRHRIFHPRPDGPDVDPPIDSPIVRRPSCESGSR